jgi:DNA-binding CsgD family transcriptional regulator
MIARLGDVMTLDSVCSDHELIETRFYKEVLKPYGYFHFIAVIALKTAGRFASLHAGRMLEAPRYSEREMSLFRLLSPHICRALAISDVLDIKTLHADVLEATLDGLAAGVYLTRRDGHVVYMNAAAERQVKSGNALRIVNNRLVPTALQMRAAIDKAISEAAADETGLVAGGHSLAIPSDTAVGYVATLLPLERGRRQSIMAPFAASVAIFAQDPARVPIMPGEAFARLYDLTVAELRVLLALAQGLAAREAADMLGISEPTVRTHVQRMLAKTGASRQAELLQLLERCAPPVGPG